ncbi:40S ribosomal protein S7 [Nymphon striatum]|nr:40S ribosomal protein S7 [Nymphon striatum]
MHSRLKKINALRAAIYFLLSFSILPYMCIYFGAEIMYSDQAKIVKPQGKPVDDLEKIVSQAILDLEMNSDLKGPLRELHITGAKEVDAMGKKAIIIFVPVPQLRGYQKIQTRLVRELEKKFSGKHVVVVAQRGILPRPTRKTKLKSKQKRPRSRTLTAVHDNMLEDLVYPAEIVGKRIRIRLDGSRLIKVHLDKNQQTNIEHKVIIIAICSGRVGSSVSIIQTDLKV